MTTFVTRPTRLNLTPWVIIAAVMLSAPPAQADAIRYSVTDITPAGATSAYGIGINNNGEVVGIADNGSFEYLSGSSRMIDINGVAHSVNDRGQISGDYGVNNAGQTVGGAVSQGTNQAFVSNNGIKTFLGTLNGGVTSEARAINEAGQVVGWVGFAPRGEHPFLFSGGKMTDLGLLPGADSGAALGINNAGLIVGGPMNGNSHAFLYQSGKLTDLGTLGGRNSDATGINDSNQIVGTSDTTTPGVTRAFLYQNSKLFDLNQLIPPTTGWTLEGATGVNDSGQIVGYGSIHGQRHAFLLTPEGAPVPEPGGLALFSTVLSAAAVGRFRRVTRRIRSKEGPSMTPFVTRLVVALSAITTLTTLAAPPARADAIRYNVTDITPAGATLGYGLGINNSGQIVGYSDKGSFRSDGQNSVLVDSTGLARSINDSGLIVSDAGVNNKGQTVDSGYTGGQWQAYLSSDGQRTYLGTLPGAIGSEARAINDAGQVVGFSSFAPRGEHPFLFSGGKMTDLGLLPGADSGAALGINNTGLVVGGPMNGNSHAFLYQSGKLTDLGTLGGRNSDATGINDSNQIVGTSDTTTPGVTRAFLYQNSKLFDLNQLIPPTTGWTLEGATAVNDAGQIVGYGSIHGQRHAYLLTPEGAPVPEPSTLAMSLILIPLIAYKVRSRRKQVLR